MYNYQNLLRDTEKGMKAVLGTVGSIISSPLTLPGIRPLTKTVIKGGLFLSDNVQSYYKEIGNEWNRLINEAQTEMQENGGTAQGPSPSEEHYESWHMNDLYARARELDIKGRSKMSKEELIEEIRTTARSA